MHFNDKTDDIAINIFYWKESNIMCFKEIFFGIEEEGIPYILKKIDYEEKGQKLAFLASKSSKLGIGIGIGDKIVVHYESIEKDSALFTIKKDSDLKKYRILGANSARIIKKIPLIFLE